MKTNKKLVILTFYKNVVKYFMAVALLNHYNLKEVFVVFFQKFCKLTWMHK